MRYSDLTPDQILVPHIDLREFMFHDEDGQRWRHYHFYTAAELITYLQDHPNIVEVFFSVSYYRYPWRAPKTEHKERIAADLCFDIDCEDPIKARNYTGKVYDILETNFGLEDIQIVETGNRGYHIHVRDLCIRLMDNRARMEVAEYIIYQIGLTPEAREQIDPNTAVLLARKMKSPLDAPVTYDLARMIRMPHSYHIKTGKRAVPITRPELGCSSCTTLGRLSV